MSSGSGRLTSLGMRGAKPVSAVAVAFLVVLACLTQPAPALGASMHSSPVVELASASTSSASVQGKITIDKQQFATDVPSYALVGENYTIRVVIDSSANITVPIIVQLTAPIGAMFVHPRVVRASVLPDSSLVANFSVLPFGEVHQGPFTVTAQVFVFFPLAMASPALADQATATVSTIGPSPIPYFGIVVVSAAVIILVLVAVFYPNIFRRAFARFSG